MASTYLTRTMSGGSATTTKFTFSAWVKRTGLSSNDGMQILSVSNEYIYLGFFADTLRMEMHDSDNVRLRSNAVFRDTNAWYHVVFTFDSTQSTASDRMKMWVNNEQITDFSHSTYPSLNYGSYIGGNTQHTLGRRENDDSDYFDGIISHAHLTVGYTYTPSAFGSTDSTTGEWKINTSPSVSYGNNGFFILKDGNSVTDQSGNSNNFTVGGGTLTKTEDCPSNVFATWNPLARFNGNFNFSNGNTSVSAPSGTWNGSIATMGFNSGKWYWEAKFSGNADNQYIGVFDESANPATNNPMNRTGTTAFYNYNGGEMIKDGSFTTADYGTITSSQTCGVAVDADNNYISIYRDGVAIVTNYALSSTKNLLFPFISVYATTADYNFGNGYFGTTAVATNSGNGYAGAEGSSIFNYQPPTGYSALSTKGLNL